MTAPAGVHPNYHAPTLICPLVVPAVGAVRGSLESFFRFTGRKVSRVHGSGVRIGSC